MKDETLSIHFGYETDPTTKSVATPIYQTVAYEFENAQHVEEDNKENAKLGEVSTKSLSLQSSYSKAEGFMILYELNNRQSFNHIYVINNTCHNTLHVILSF